MSTIKSVQFDPSIIRGWTKDAEDEHGISWVDNPTDTNHMLIMQRFDHNLGIAFDDLDAIRVMYRTHANGRGAGLVSCDLLAKSAVPLIRVLEKVPMQPHGMAYEGTLYVAGKVSTFVFRVVCAERGMTGMRDTAIMAELLGQGLINVDPATETMRGWAKDPYDPDGAYVAMPNVSEHEKYDSKFPDHPLSRCRALLQRLVASLHFDDSFLTEEGLSQSSAVAKAAVISFQPPQTTAVTNDEIQSLITAAHNGDLAAQFLLSKAYVKGKGVKADPEDAIFWLRKSAKGGYTEAQYELGMAYDDGAIVEYDLEEAARWHRMAAEKGHIQAEVNLGCILENQGKLEEAAGWFSKAAKDGPKHGNSLGLSNYGRCLLYGIGVSKNAHEAVINLKAALQVDPENDRALYMLACCYEDGDGIEQDYRQAFDHFRKAGGLNYGKAQYEVGKFYLEGKGVDRDRNAAIEWFDKAMRRGHKEATRLLTQLREEASAQ